MNFQRFGHTSTYISQNKVFIFGGAVESNENSFVTTNDSFVLELDIFQWRKLENTGTVPCQRAAHHTCQIDENEIILFGGALVGGQIAKDQLYLCKIEATTANWTEIKTVGDKPSSRYGHTLVFCKPFVILFGGSTGTETMNDTWCLNIAEKSLSWTKLNITGHIPSPRVYHSADLCQYGGASGMIIVFGGRDFEGKTLNEVWGLRRHRDGKWDWTKPPEKTESLTALGRYQHRSIFYGSLMFNIGGKVNESVCNNLLTVYDYEYNKWYTVPGPECFRHISWIWGDKVFVQGGLDGKNKIMNKGEILKISLIDLFKDFPELSKKIRFFFDKYFPNVSPLSSRSASPVKSESTRTMVLEARQSNEAITPVSEKQRQGAKNQKKITVQLRSTVKNPTNFENSHNLANHFISVLLRPKSYSNLSPDVPFPFKNEEIIELCNQLEHIIKNQPMMVEVEVPIKIFGDIHGQYSDLMRFFDLWGAPVNPEVDPSMEVEDNYSYLFLGDYVDRGHHSLETICLLMALKLRFPNKIYLLRGNHEDRWINQNFGFYDECEQRLSENPDLAESVFNRINNLFEYFPLAGLIEKTILCLHGGIGSSLEKIEQIITIPRPLEIIHEVQTSMEKLVVDILWSDPTDHDGELGVQPNHVRDPYGTGNIVKFGPDVVKAFNKRNNIQKIIRAHECVLDGFERFAGGDLITLFSATDYVGKHKNAGAILVISKSLEIHPKLIYPTMQQSNWIEEDEAGYRPPTPPRWSGNPQSNYQN